MATLSAIVLVAIALVRAALSAMRARSPCAATTASHAATPASVLSYEFGFWQVEPLQPQKAEQPNPSRLQPQEEEEQEEILQPHGLLDVTFTVTGAAAAADDPDCTQRAQQQRDVSVLLLLLLAQISVLLQRCGRPAALLLRAP